MQLLQRLPGKHIMNLSQITSYLKQRSPELRRRPMRNTPIAALEKLEDRTLLTGFTTDVDGDGRFDALTDGITALRFMAGFTGDALVGGSVNPAGRRADAAEIEAFLNSDEMQGLLDLDGNGNVASLTDGILMLRGLAGFTGDALVNQAVDPLGERIDSRHIKFIIDQASSINDRAEATEGLVLMVPAEDGVLQNDAPGVTITNSDSISKLGATVEVFADGSYSYNPLTSPSLNQLSVSELVADEFSYTIDDGNRTQQVIVQIGVAGTLDGSEDLFTTDDNSPIDPNGSNGQATNILANDNGTGLTVVDYDTTSELGARVSISDDGLFLYDPTVSAQLNAMTVGDVLHDKIHYTTKDSSDQQQQSVITVEVHGANDSPTAISFHAGTEVSAAPLTLFPLNFVSDVDRGDSLTITNVTPSQSAEGTAVLNNDGSVTYDASASHLDILAKGEIFRDIFSFTVTDSSGAAQTRDFVVLVSGEANAPTPFDDDYNHIQTFRSNRLSFVTPEHSILRNDIDIDGDDVFLVTTGTITTERQATVTLFADGSFDYDPSTSAELQALPSGEELGDSFSYTVNDSSGGGETQATVSFDVLGTGIDVASGIDRNPVIDLSGTHSEGAEVSISLEDGQFFDVIVVKDEQSGQQIDSWFDFNLDSLTIIGTAHDDIIFGRADLDLRLIIDGGMGDDELTGGRSPDLLIGGPGDDFLSGGGGLDQVFGGPGADTIEFASDILIRFDDKDSTFEGIFYDTLNNTPTPAELSQVGDMFVRLVGTSSNGSYITVSGPSGYGFQLNGRWDVTQNSNGGETFTGSNVVMQTKIGAVPLGLVTLNAGPDVGQQIMNSGPLISAADGIFNAVALLTNNPIINEINQLTGIEFDSNLLAQRGITFGVKLGSDLLANELSDFGAPLNNAIPYIFASFNPGTDIVTFGDNDEISLSSSTSARMAFVFDPADPFFWVKGELNGIAGGIGWSQQGNIPFTPQKTPDHVPSTEQIFGNIWGNIKVPIKKVFGVEGEVVLDYDRTNGPGNYSEQELPRPVNKSEFLNLLTESSPDLEVVVDALTNIEVGINGKLTFEPSKGVPGIGAELGLELPIGSATAMFYGGNTFAFQGSTDDPFAAIPVLGDIGLNPGPDLRLDGFLDINTLDFRIEASASTGGKIGPFELTGTDLSFVIENSGINLDLEIDTPISRVEFHGFITFQERRTNDLLGNTTIFKPGAFEAEATLTPLDLDFDIVSVRASATMRISNVSTTYSSTSLDDYFAGNITTTHEASSDVTLTLDMSLSARSFILDIDGNLTIDVTVGSSGFNINGNANLLLDWAGPGSARFDFGISNAGIRVQVDLALFELDVTVPIPGFLHVDQIAVGGPMSDDQILQTHALPGIVDEAIRRLERTGLDQDEVALLQTVEYRVTSLDDEHRAVGYAAGTTVTLDDNAAGHGWFIDSTPSDDAEFDVSASPTLSSPAVGRVDLLSVVIHELTHVLESAYPDKLYNFGEVGHESISTGHRFAVGNSSELYGHLTQGQVVATSETEFNGSSLALLELDSVFQDLLDIDRWGEHV